MKNTGRNTITTDPLTTEIEAHVARTVPQRHLESNLDWQLRREAEIMRLHFGFQQFLDLFLHNPQDRQMAVEVFRAAIPQYAALQRARARN